MRRTGQRLWSAMRHGGRHARGRRGVGFASVLSLVAGLLAATAVGTVTGSSPAAAADAPWQCAPYGYLFQTPDSGQHLIQAVDLATGAVVNTTTMTDTVNAAGFNVLDDYVYAWDSGIVRINADGTVSRLPLPAGMATNYTTYIGDVDANGHYWLLGSVTNSDGTGTRGVYYEIDYAPGSPTNGQLLSQGSFNFPSDVHAIAQDWVWDHGSLYGMAVDAAGNYVLIQYAPTGDGSTITNLGEWVKADGQPVAQVASATMGALYADAAGDIFASINDSGEIYRITPATRATLDLVAGPVAVFNDGARCATAPMPTITVAKQVAGRVAPGDQFTVGLQNSAGKTLTSATTSGAGTAAATPDWPVSPSTGYTITDAMAAGSPDAISAYTATISCQTSGGDPVAASGDGPWTVTSTAVDAITCTVTNTPVAADFGDAPDTYGTTLAKDGARSPIVPGLTLGTAIDSEPDGQPTDAANGDDNNGTDDEDGVARPIEIQTQVPTVVQVSATNNTDQPATLAGWIDLDHSGTFDSGELQSIAIPANSGTATYPLSWPAQDPPGDPTYARFRLLSGAVSQPSATGDWAAGGEVEDYLVQSRALAITKTSNATDATRIGDTVHYTVTVSNIGGADFTTDNPAELLDDLTGVLDDATFDGNVAVTGSDVQATYAAPQIHWSGPLAAGDVVQFDYNVVLNGKGDLDVQNVAFEPPPCETGQCPPPTPPTPADCTANGGYDPATDLPCIGTDLLLPKLALTKTSPLTSARPGDRQSFTVTATNVGKRDYPTDHPALVIDDLTDVLDDAVFDGTVTVDGSDAQAVYDAPQIRWSGALAVGDSVSLTYQVVLTGKGNRVVTNVAFVPPTPVDCGTGQCPPSTPPNPADCAANHNVDPVTGLACAGLSEDLRTLTIAKTSDAAGIVHDGDVVTYTVTAKNGGPGDYTADRPAVVVDDLSGALDDATYNGDASADVDGTMGYVNSQLSWVGALPAGKTVTITYTVTVTGAGDLDLLNVAFAPPPMDAGCVADGSCPPPRPCAGGVDGATSPPCATTDTPLPGLYVTKKVDKTAASGGDVVAFTVTMTNTGNVPFTAAAPAVLTDDLTGVLDDAQANGDAAADRDGDLAYADGLLTWTGALDVGATVTVTYSVTVNTSATGDDKLDNVASIPDDISPHYLGGVCPDGAATCDPASPRAETITDVSRAPLPDTGANALGELWLAGLLLLVGSGLAVVGRRCRGHRPA